MRASANQFKTRSAEPERSVTAANNILNQFELPVLFHIGCLTLFPDRSRSRSATLTFAWLFILSRCAHAWVHLTTNRVRHRTTLFRAGMAMVGLIWIWLALRLAEVVFEGSLGATGTSPGTAQAIRHKNAGGATMRRRLFASLRRPQSFSKTPALATTPAIAPPSSGATM